MIQATINQNKLPHKTLEAFISIVVNSIDEEYQRTGVEKKAHAIFDYLLEQYMSVNYYTFFTPDNLVTVTENIFEQSILRDFFLNLTDRVLLQWSDNEALDSIIEHTANQYARNKPQSEDTLLIKSIRESIGVNKEILKQCLSRDLWLLVIFYTLLNFNYTNLYKSVTQ